MKIFLISDLHIDFDKAKNLDLPGGEILLLAGDLCEVGSIPAVKPTLLTQLSKYDRIISVLGNHEHYSSDFECTHTLYKEALPEVELLENTWTELPEGVILFGATLWTNLNRDCPLVSMRVSSWSDYKHIRIGDRKLRAQDTLFAHRATIRALYDCIETFPDRKIIVMTHFLPSRKSVHSRYSMSTDNWFFYSDLEDIILSNPNLVAWCHGHAHDAYDYMIGQCRVMCNPRGYTTAYNTEQTGWNPTFTFEI